MDPSIGRFRNMVRTAVIPVNKTNRKRASEVQGDLFDFYAPDKKLIHQKTSSGLSDENLQRKNESIKSGMFLINSRKNFI